MLKFSSLFSAHASLLSLPSCSFGSSSSFSFSTVLILLLTFLFFLLFSSSLFLFHFYSKFFLCLCSHSHHSSCNRCLSISHSFSCCSIKASSSVFCESPESLHRASSCRRFFPFSFRAALYFFGSVCSEASLSEALPCCQPLFSFLKPKP